MKPDKNLIQSFKDAGSSEIPEAGASAREIVLDVLKAYPDRWFTQKDFTTNLKDVPGIGHSNPYVNNVLRKLAEKNDIESQKRGRNVFYRHQS